MKIAISADDPKNLIAIPHNLVKLLLINSEGISDAEKIAKHVNSNMQKEVIKTYYSLSPKARNFLLKFRDNLSFSISPQRNDFLYVPENHVRTARTLGVDGLIKYNNGVSGPYSLILIADPLMANKYMKRLLTYAWKNKRRTMPEPALECNFTTGIAKSLPELKFQYKRKFR